MLVATVDSPTTPLPAAADAAQHLSQLRQAGVPAARDVDPGNLFLSAQVRAITAIIETSQREFTSALSALETEFKLQKRRKEALELNSSTTNSRTGAGAAGDMLVQQRRGSTQRWWEQQQIFENDNSQSFDQLNIDSSFIDASFTDLWTMTESLINWLLDLLAATSTSKNKNSSSSSSIEAAAIWETQQQAIEKSANEVLNTYSKAVVVISQAQLKSEALWEAVGTSGVAEPLLSTLVAGFLAFEQHSSISGNKSSSRDATMKSSSGSSGLDFVTGRLQSLIRDVAEAAFSSMETRLTTSARYFALSTLTTSESFTTSIAIAMGGTTMNKAVPPPAASLRLLLCCGMRWALTLSAQCTQVGTDGVGETSHAYKILCSTAMAFVEATLVKIQAMHPLDTSTIQRQLSSVSLTAAVNNNNTISGGGGGSGGANGVNDDQCRDSQLLQAWEILRSISNTVIPQVFTVFEVDSTVHSDGAAAMKKCSHQIESLSDGIIRAYLDRKLTLLDGIMEDFLSPVVPEAAAETGETVDAAAFTEACALVANWKENFAPKHARPIVWTLLCILGGIRTELLAYSPSLCKEVMLEVLQGVVGGVTELLESGFIETSPPERVYQLWLDVVVLQFAVKKLGDDGDRVETDVEKLCAALEKAFSASLKACGEENCASYTPPQAGGRGSGDRTVSMGDHRRWVQKVCDSEVKNADAVMKAFSPQHHS